MNRSLRRLGHDWETLATQDPLWAILTDPCTRGGLWDVEQFFESGRREVRLLLEELETHDAMLSSREHLAKQGQSLDFGCGVGRLTQGLCEHFRGAVGLDISPTMIRLANEHNRFDERCRYVINDAPDLDILGDATFDLCYSFIVLQHMPWPVARGYLADMAERLKPQGLLVFQLPATGQAPPAKTPLHAFARRALPQPVRRWRHRLFGDPLAARMQMHATPRPVVEVFLDSLGLRIKYARPSHAAGPGYEGWLYVAGRA